MLKTVSLLAILPALTFAFFIPFPISVPVPDSSKMQEGGVSQYPHVDNLEKATKFQTTHNSKICSFVDYVDTVLCNSTESDSLSFNQNQNDTKESKNNFFRVAKEIIPGLKKENILCGYETNGFKPHTFLQNKYLYNLYSSIYI